jgi:hypothetical protein
MLRPVALVRTDVSEERIASIIKVIIIDELGTIVFLPSVRRVLVTADVLGSTIL